MGLAVLASLLSDVLYDHQSCCKPRLIGRLAKGAPPVLDVVEAQVEADSLGQQG